MGYRLDEIIGRHHSMFAEKDFAKSQEYKDFWDKLNNGEYQSAQYKRIGKDGKEVWIEASYNPISGKEKKPYKIIKYATDITESSLQHAELKGLFEGINRSQAMISFKMDGTILHANNNFLNTMGYELEEIVGEHHSIFIDSEFAKTMEYQDFWHNLNKGEYQSAQYKRIGKNGNTIFVYKFRTMHPYSEYVQKHIYELNQLDEGGKFKNDFRVTFFGRFLRKFWIDELPMFWNLLKGQVKLVGVRPLSEQYLSLYTEEVRQKRIKFKPGIIPPFYVDMPKTIDEIMASEMRYIAAYEKKPFFTDVSYFYTAIYNIIFKKARSK